MYTIKPQNMTEAYETLTGQMPASVGDVRLLLERIESLHRKIGGMVRMLDAVSACVHRMELEAKK
jgi:hypothetical protein